MVGSVRSRPGHYEILGLIPSASDEEIRQAFANRMSLVAAHAPAAAAQLCMAFETLRDPVRRHNYDRSIGLMHAPQLLRWTVPATELHWTPFVAAAPVERAARKAPEPHVTERHEGLPSIPALPALETRQARGRPQRAAEAEGGSFDWRRPATAVGGLVLVAALIGTIAGMSARDGEEAQAEPAAAATISPPRPHPAPVAVSPPVPIEAIKPPTHWSHHRYRATRRHAVAAHYRAPAPDSAPAPQPVVPDAGGDISGRR